MFNRLFARLKELVLALLVALVCRYGNTVEKYSGYLEVTTWGPLQWHDYSLGSCSLALHKGQSVRILLAE